MNPHRQRYLLVRTRGRRLSLLVHRRTLALVLLLLGLCAVLAAVSAGLGDTRVAPVQAVRAVFGAGAPEHIMVVRQLRLPRTINALLVGGALAGAGALLQSMIRNPLASPDTIGVTGGASTAAVLFLTYLSGRISIHWLPFFALLGAGAAAAALYALAWKNGTTPIRLVLIGVGMSALASAATTMMMMFNPQGDAAMAYLWLTGSLYATGWKDVLTLLPWAAVLLPLALAMSRHVSIGQLGDDAAAGAGSAVERNRLLLLLISIGLAASAVSVAGGVGFVGLLAPHMARKLVGPSFALLFPVAVLLGAIVVLVADTLGRTLFLPLDVPVGVFTSMVGAPFFIYLLYRRRNG